MPASTPLRIVWGCFALAGLVSLGCGSEIVAPVADDVSPILLDGGGVGEEVGQDAPGDSNGADADAHADAPSNSVNACGGRARLSVDGADAAPGSACGCGGTLACNGVDDLRCVGEVELNVCGGCGTLESAPGEPCGDCGDGVWICDQGALWCEGARQLNVCGGCTALEGAPGAPCDGPTSASVWVCLGSAAVGCRAAADGNVCGGSGPLRYRGAPALPGERCGAPCGDGRLVCDPTLRALRCHGPIENDCGGCGPLVGELGTRCGCDPTGVWECDAESGAAVCSGGGTNTCGGCQTLALEPASACGTGGVRICIGGDATVCVDPGDVSNGCGGNALLPSVPGTPCGACGAGEFVCDGLNDLLCIAPSIDAVANECGGCAVLGGPIAAPCGACGVGELVCAGVDGQSCLGDPGPTGRNACGGCEPLTTTPGASCGTCAIWRCAGGAVECGIDFDTPGCAGPSVGCEDLDCEALFRRCDETGDVGARCGACLDGYREVGGVCLAEECTDASECATNFGTWSDCQWPDACAEVARRTRTVTPGVCEDGGCGPGEPRVEEEDCATRVSDGLTCAGGVCSARVCVSTPLVPTGLQASVDRPDRVVVNWQPSAGAVRYEIDIGGTGTWIDVGSATTYSDAAAPPSTITTCSGAGLSASQGDFAAHVALACAGASVSPGASRMYRVRAVNDAGVSASSAPVSGNRSAGALAYQWQRASASAGPYSTLTGATTASFNDTGAPADGSPRWYRVALSASGAVSVTSTSVSGFRLPAVTPPATPTGIAATTDRQSDIRVTWNAVSGATSYEIEIGGTGVWSGIGGVTSYTDTSAPAPSIDLCAGSDLRASQGTSVTHVALACDGATANPGSNRAYRVRALNAAGSGTPSIFVTGSRAVGTLAYRWERAVTAGSTYSSLPGATSATHNDATAPADGSARWYRVVLSASGATTRTSAAVSGYRAAAGIGELGTACVLGATCASGFCGNGRCSPQGFSFIPATGTSGFVMGSPDEEPGRSTNEGPQHSVVLSRAFFMQQNEVTQGEWSAIAGTNPAHFGAAATCDSVACPVERVSYWDVVEYANRRSEAEGIPAEERCYRMRSCSGSFGTGCTGAQTACLGDYVCEALEFVGLECRGYRLPTEAEWEYAYRAGTSTAYYSGPVDTNSDGVDANLSMIGWYAADVPGATRPVAQRRPNAWGLYDMSGNVAELVWDRIDNRYYISSPEIDPLGPDTGSPVIRGGAWQSTAAQCRGAARGSNPIDRRIRTVGFRLARTVP